MDAHDTPIHATWIARKGQSSVALHASESFSVNMIEIAQRLRQRIDEVGTTQKELAKATGFSTARLGNYVSLSDRHNRTPDVQSLARLARALRTSTDWLLGLSEAAPIDAAAVIQRLLELDGMSAAKASVIAQASARAIELLAALPGDGDAQTRAHLAAQAAWTLRSHSAPS